MRRTIVNYANSVELEIHGFGELPCSSCWCPSCDAGKFSCSCYSRRIVSFPRHVVYSFQSYVPSPCEREGLCALVLRVGEVAIVCLESCALSLHKPETVVIQ